MTESLRYCSHTSDTRKVVLPGAVLIATDPRQYIYSPSKYHGKNGGKIHQFIANKVNTKRHEYVTIDEHSHANSETRSL